MDRYSRHCEEADRPTWQSRFWIASLALAMTMFLFSPAYAQDDPDSTYEKRLKLAEQMHTIWPTRLKVEKALDRAVVQLPPDQRATFKSAMRRAIKFKQLEEESIDAMVRTFTLEELEAMVEFYGSPVGRSINAKIGGYQAEISPVFTRMLDRALMDIKTGNTPGDIQ